MRLGRLALGAAAVAASGCAATDGEEVRPPAAMSAFARCNSCHSLQPGDNLPSGPTLYGVVGRPVAAETGFDYSPALSGFATRNPRWTPELLDRFIADPEAMAPGTYMAFPGIADPAGRAAVIELLKRR